jgi:hypothetical protein
MAILPRDCCSQECVVGWKCRWPWDLVKFYSMLKKREIIKETKLVAMSIRNSPDARVYGFDWADPSLENCYLGDNLKPMPNNTDI